MVCVFPGPQGLLLVDRTSMCKEHADVDRNLDASGSTGNPQYRLAPDDFSDLDHGDNETRIRENASAPC